MLDSFKDTWNHFLDRLKSPFGGAFIVAWIIIHWQAVYYFIFVDSEIGVFERIQYLHFEFDKGSIKENLYHQVLQPAIYALTAIAVYYTFSMLAGIITGYYKRQIEPIISDKLGIAEVVTKELYIEVKKINSILEKDIEELNTQKDLLHNSKNVLERQNQIDKQLHDEFVKTSKTEKDEELKVLNDELFKLKALYEGQKSENERQLANFREMYSEGTSKFHFNPISKFEFEKYFLPSGTNYFDPDGSNLYNFENFTIAENKYIIHNSTKGIKHKYNISEMFYNPTTQQLTFEKRLSGSNKIVYINYLNKINDNLLVGAEQHVESGKFHLIAYNRYPTELFPALNLS